MKIKQLHLKSFKLVASFLVVCCFFSGTVGLEDYFNATYFDDFNPPPEGFNTNSNQIGFDSRGNDNPNALQFTGGASVSETPMYDNYGNQLVVDGVSVVTEEDQVGYYDGYHNGKIHAGAIASINIDGQARDCIYLNSVDIQNSGTFSGWIKVDQMEPSSVVWQYSQEINERRESVRYTANPEGSSRYEQMEVIDEPVPSSLEGGYILPERTSNAGKVDYYYYRDGLINGFINLPETGNKRHGVQCSRVEPGAPFWRDLDVDNYIQNIYAYNSTTIMGTFRWCYGYFETNAGTKIYCWTNRECLQSVEQTTSTFTPDSSKTYYIDSPVHNLRLAATGESEDAYTTSTNNTGDNVQWQFVAKGNGSWHVQRAAGGTKPRLRTDNSANADMQETTSSGTFTYYDMQSTGSGNTYFFTLPNGPSDYTRLQVNNSGNVKMVSSSHDGSWESFTITEAGSVSSGTSSIVHLTKRNATGFAIDGNNGATDFQEIYLWEENDTNVNQQWVEIDRGNGYYSYQKQGTDYCIDGNNGGINNQEVYLYSCGENNYNQHWQKVDAGGGAYKLIKRNALGYALNGGSGGENEQGITLYDSSVTSQNIQWYITPIDTSAKAISVINTEEVAIYPNPVISTAIITGAADSTLTLFDMSGRLLMTQEISSESETIDLSAFSSGLYCSQISGSKSITIIKIVKD